jgi:hypothetical protein
MKTLQQRLEEQGWRRPGLDEYCPARGRSLIPPLVVCRVTASAEAGVVEVAHTDDRAAVTDCYIAPVYIVFGENIERVEYLTDATPKHTWPDAEVHRG